MLWPFYSGKDRSAKTFFTAKGQRALSTGNWFFFATKFDLWFALMAFTWISYQLSQKIKHRYKLWSLKIQIDLKSRKIFSFFSTQCIDQVSKPNRSLKINFRRPFLEMSFVKMNSSFQISYWALRVGPPLLWLSIATWA